MRKNWPTQRHHRAQLRAQHVQLPAVRFHLCASELMQWHGPTHLRAHHVQLQASCVQLRMIFVLPGVAHIGFLDFNAPSCSSSFLTETFPRDSKEARAVDPSMLEMIRELTRVVVHTNQEGARF